MDRVDVQQNKCLRTYNIHEDIFDNLNKKYEEQHFFLILWGELNFKRHPTL